MDIPTLLGLSISGFIWDILKMLLMKARPYNSLVRTPMYYPPLQGKPWSLVVSGTQKAQYPLIKEYTLNQRAQYPLIRE